MNILRQLSMANAVSGDEMYLIPRLFPQLIEKYRPENIPLIDTMGSVTLFRRGESSEKTVAVIAHTDEAGFIVNDITDKGFIKFEEVGTIDPRVIISKKVTIGKNAVKGVIGMKAIHLQKREERESVVPMKELFIDIGAKNKADALKQVSIGDYISFATEFGELCDGVIKGKALDRLSAACLAEIIDITPKYDTYYIFSAQKHIGSRGAIVALERIAPDYAFIVDAVETADSFGAKPEDTTALLHSGAVIAFSDMRGIADEELLNKVLITADPAKVRTQIAHGTIAPTETGAVRSAYGGTKAVLIGIPCRYTNSPVSLMSLDDIKSVTKLLGMIIKEI